VNAASEVGGAAVVFRVMVLALFLELADLAVELVDQPVYRGVHVTLDFLCVECGTPNVQRRFGLVAQLFNRQDYAGVYQVIEVPFQSLHLARNEFPQRAGEIDMVAGNLQIHVASWCVEIF
jgi:hypothetical protein